MKGTLTNQDFNTLLTVLKNNNYEVFERPYELNIVGVRTDGFIPNSFNDWIIVFYYICIFYHNKHTSVCAVCCK